MDTIIRLQRRSQTGVASTSGVHPSNLSKFLNGETDIRSSSLIEIFRALEIDVEQILENEIDKIIGKHKADSIGDAIETLLEVTDPVSARTLLDSFSKRVKKPENRQVQNALDVVNDFKSKLKTVRRH